MLSRYAPVVLHVVAVVVDLSAVIYYETIKLPVSLLPPFAGSLKFLTIWNMIAQSVYFTLSSVNDFCESDAAKLPERPTRLRKVKDYMFSAIVFPVTTFVGVTFWSLWMIDRELVIPREIEAVLPSWLNHIMHTNILVFLALEMVLVGRHYPPWRWGLAGMTTFMAVYVVWMNIIYFVTGAWVYPVMNTMGPFMRVVFIASLLLCSCGMYFVGHWINNWIWERKGSSADAEQGVKGTKDTDTSSPESATMLESKP